MRITHRLQFIRLITLAGILSSVLLSLNLWAGQRWFPKAPLFDELTGLIAPYDYANLAVLVILLVISFVSQSRIPLVLLILFNLYLCVDDQNRLQPWFYNYTLILAVLLFFRNRVDEPNNFTTVFITLQILMALIYIFSGLQKFNSFFVDDTFKWLISPLESVFSGRQMALFYKLGKAVPYIELFIGVGLLIKPARYIVLPLVISMHVFILLMLGPTGNAYNYVVWPWNIVMILLNLLLFANVKQERFYDISILFKGLSFYLVITLMLIFPIFSFNNKYDSYLSSSLYSANTNNCKLILSDKAYEQLPYYIRNFVTKDADYNILFIKHWALNELGTPCVPEYRIFKKVQERVIILTNTSAADVKMDFTEREKLLDF
jgi:hypothetical protein